MKRETETSRGRRLLNLRGLIEAAEALGPAATETQLVRFAMQYGGSWRATENELQELLNYSVRTAVETP